MTFINRHTELRALNEKWGDKKPHLFILYGKRRVGKTELIKQFIKDKPSLYFLADKRPESELLKELGRIAGDFFQDNFLKARGFGGWLDVFQYLKDKNKKLIFAVDEYPYLLDAGNATGTLFQNGWDAYLKNSPVFLILSGSSISMMESEALAYTSPLYGRRTGQILLQPLPFMESSKFFPGKSFDEQLQFFTVTGGMPAYLLEINPAATLKENIKEKIFNRTAFLHNEIEFLTKEEFREPKNYLSILKAIAMGKRKFSEIINETGMGKNVLTRYINTLEHLSLIEKETPVTEKNPEKSRKGLYRIADNFIRFWFQFVFPFKSDLEIGRFQEALRKVDENFKYQESLTYESVCSERLGELSGVLFPFERIGKWWEREQEIDVVGLNQGTGDIVFGEAKWSEKQVGTDVFHALKKKADQVLWQPQKRKEHFILFSKSGYTKDMRALAKKEGVLLVHKDKLL